jgi:uncharacterized small protein (DUF1192 family)
MIKLPVLLISTLVILVPVSDFAQPKSSNSKKKTTNTTKSKAEYSSPVINEKNLTLADLAKRITVLEEENKRLKDEMEDIRKSFSVQSVLVNLLSSDHKQLKENFKNHYHTIYSGAWGNTVLKKKEGNSTYYMVLGDPKASKTKETSTPTIKE